MNEFHLYLSSGAVLTVHAETFRITYSSATGKATGWEVKGLQEGTLWPTYISPDSIDALVMLNNSERLVKNES